MTVLRRSIAKLRHRRFYFHTPENGRNKKWPSVNLIKSQAAFQKQRLFNGIPLDPICQEGYLFWDQNPENEQRNFYYTELLL